MMCLDEDRLQEQEPSTVCSSTTLHQLLEPLMIQQRDIADKLATLSSNIRALEQQVTASPTGRSRWQNFSERDVAALLVAIFLQIFFIWLLK